MKELVIQLTNNPQFTEQIANQITQTEIMNEIKQEVYTACSLDAEKDVLVHLVNDPEQALRCGGWYAQRLSSCSPPSVPPTNKWAWRKNKPDPETPVEQAV